MDHVDLDVITKKEERPSSEVKELIPLQYDLRLLTAYDPRYIDAEELKEPQYLKSISREGAQLLVNKLFSLNTTRVDNSGVYVVLPPACTNLPRARPFPKKKPLTRWEKFAKLKGITPKNKSKKVYSDKDEKFRNRWGYEGLNDPREEWLTEIKESEDPLPDKFKELEKIKKDRIRKNKLSQLKNEKYFIRKDSKSAKLTSLEKKKSEIRRKIISTKLSTASLGLFTKEVRNEKNIRIRKPKQKFDPDAIPISNDINKAKDIAKRVLKDQDTGVVNVARVVKTFRKDKEIGRKQKNKRATKKSGKRR